jgi:hypothetical protein
MPHELKRVVDLRAWREQQADRALRAQREALHAAEQQRQREQLALQHIEESARGARAHLGEAAAPMKAADAHALLAYAASRRHGAREALLSVRRAEAEVAQAQQQVQAARETWQQRARAHTKMRHQSNALVRTAAATALRRSEEAGAEEHLEGWITRRTARIDAGSCGE